MSARILASSVSAGNFTTGTYTGDGAATQAVVGVGFRPKYVIIYKQIAVDFQHPAEKTDQQTTQTKVYDGVVDQWVYQDDHIISLDANGFTVGDGTGGLGNVCNVLGQMYSYVCFG